MADNDNSITRRDFTKGVAVGTMAGALGTMGIYSYSPLAKQHFAKAPAPKENIGEVKSVKVTNLSETSWFDNKVLMGDIKGAGGLLVNQYTYNWPPFTQPKGQLGKGSYEDGMKTLRKLLPHKLEEAWAYQLENAVHPTNAGGFTALIEVELLDGEVKRILLDSGWSFDWIDKAFKREGVDKLLAAGKIDYFVMSHEHFDHFWGVPVVFKYAPTVRALYPKGFYAEGLDYIKAAGHRGELIEVQPGLHKLFAGAALYNFQTPIICRVFGEMSLFFNVKDKGLAIVTGCCHQGILQFASVAQRAVETKKLYGIYGGLHISPFDEWDPKYDDLVAVFKKWGFEKVGCNHCTGIVTAKKLIEAGVGIVQGTARNGSKDKAYLGNGDQIVFAMNDSDTLAQPTAVPTGTDGSATTPPWWSDPNRAKSGGAAPPTAGGSVKY